MKNAALVKDMDNVVSFDTWLEFFAYAGGMSNILLNIYSLFVVESILGIAVNRGFGYWASDSEDFQNGVRDEIDNMIYFKALLGALIII